VMRSPVGHDLELLSFLLVGVAFWIPVYGAGRCLNDHQRITYVLLALPVIATTGLVLWSSSLSSLSITSMNMSRVSLSDVHGGGVVMMVWGTVGMMSHFLIVSLNSAVELRSQHRPIGHRYA
jgi:cytochrome c oxidase assembly factor CtaG